MSTPSIIVWPTRSPVEVGSMCPTWRKLPSSLSILVSHSDPEEHLVPWVWCFCCLISSIMAAFSSSELISISFAPLPLQYLMDSCQVIGFSTKLETNSISHFWTIHTISCKPVNMRYRVSWCKNFAREEKPEGGWKESSVPHLKKNSPFRREILFDFYLHPRSTILWLEIANVYWRNSKTVPPKLKDQLKRVPDKKWRWLASNDKRCGGRSLLFGICLKIVWSNKSLKNCPEWLDA